MLRRSVSIPARSLAWVVCPVLLLAGLSPLSSAPAAETDRGAILRLLPEDTAYLEYGPARTPAGKPARGFALTCTTRDGARILSRSYSIAADAGEILETGQDIAADCADPQKDYRSKARDLHRLLLAPAGPQLRGK